MANVKLSFFDPESNDKIETFVNTRNRIFIAINYESHDCNSAYMELDVETAVRLSRELKRQIALLKEFKEESNG